MTLNYSFVFPRLYHPELSANLRLDINRSNQSWSSFKEVSTNYSLEGDPIDWLCCAIFLACRSSEEERGGQGNG